MFPGNDGAPTLDRIDAVTDSEAFRSDRASRHKAAARLRAMVARMRSEEIWTRCSSIENLLDFSPRRRR
jgi:hypothetical protein